MAWGQRATLAGPDGRTGCQWGTAAETTRTAWLRVDRRCGGRASQLAQRWQLDGSGHWTASRRQLASVALEDPWQRCFADVGRPGFGENYQQRWRRPGLVDPLGGTSGRRVAMAAATACWSDLGMAKSMEPHWTLGAGPSDQHGGTGDAASHATALVQPPALATPRAVMRRRPARPDQAPSPLLGVLELAGNGDSAAAGWVGWQNCWPCGLA